MNKLPKSVIHRLAKPASGAVVHPEADLLAAFVEHRLVAREREEMLAHLAGCSLCREVVALSAPEQLAATASPAHSTAGMRAWWQWPNMRWLSLAAACVIVAAIGLMLRTEQFSPAQHPLELADSTSTAKPQERPSATPAAPPVEVKQNTAEPARVESKRSQLKSLRDRDKDASLLRDSMVGVKHAEGLATTQPQGTGKEIDRMEAGPGSQAAAVPTPSVPAPQAPATRNGLSGIPIDAEGRQQNAPQLFTGNVNQQERKFVIQPQQQAPLMAKSQQQSSDDLRQASASAPQAGPSSGSTVEAASTPLTVETRGNESAAKIGGITLGAHKSPSGSKGFSAGMALNSMAGRAKSSLDYTDGAASWKISPEGKLLRKYSSENGWHEIHLPVPATLHALASNGADVWAGGSPSASGTGGLLFHSEDAGEHWRQVNGPWRDDILALQTSGPQHKTVAVRTPEGEWQSQDAGMNWIRTR